MCTKKSHINILYGILGKFLEQLVYVNMPRSTLHLFLKEYFPRKSVPRGLISNTFNMFVLDPFLSSWYNQSV